jgi:hypothetical protein
MINQQMSFCANKADVPKRGCINAKRSYIQVTILSEKGTRGCVLISSHSHDVALADDARPCDGGIHS